MKEKILQLLRAKFQGTHNVVLDRVADHLSQTVKEESELETAIAGVEPLVKSFSEVLQSETDRRVTDAQKKAIDNFRQKHGLDENGKPIQKPNPEPPGGGQTPPQNPELKKLQERLEAFEKKEKQGELMNSLKQKLKEKKIPEAFIKGRTVESEDQIDNVLKEIETDFNGVKQHFINEGVLTETPPDPLGGIDKADEEIAAWAGSKSEK
jgi:hypothetical protein